MEGSKKKQLTTRPDLKIYEKRKTLPKPQRCFPDMQRLEKKIKGKSVFQGVKTYVKGYPVILSSVVFPASTLSAAVQCKLDYWYFDSQILLDLT